MATAVLDRVIQRFRRGALAGAGGPTDGQLLEAFIVRRDPFAFEALVRRHGPMVMGVCQRVIGKAQEAEDAFQVTFLVLVRKANSIVPRKAVGNWLYGVAHRTALEARARISRRYAKEKQVTAMPDAAAPAEEAWQDLRPLLDHELSRLPDKYRLPLVLCELESRSRKDVARQLDVPEGTLSSRLATARRMLAKRLAGRGLALSAGSLAVVLSQSAVSASVPGSLVVSTVEAAALMAAGKTAAHVISSKVALLTEGMVRAMLMTKLKVTAAFLVAVSLVVGGATVGHRALGETPAGEVISADFEPIFEEEAQRRPASDGVSVNGKLDGVMANSITISVFKRGEGATPKTFTVATDAKITQDGKEVKLADLKKGSQTTLKLSAADQSVAVSISTDGPVISGSLKSVDAARNTITLSAGSRRLPEDKTYEVAKDVKIQLDGKEARLADLKLGATLSLTVVDGSVIRIRTAVRGTRREE